MQTSLSLLFPSKQALPEDKWSTAKEEQEPLILHKLCANYEPVSFFKEFISQGRHIKDYHWLWFSVAFALNN